LSFKPNKEDAQMSDLTSDEQVVEKSEVELELERLIEPLQKLSDELGLKEAELATQLQQLRAQRNRVSATLRSIMPPVPKEENQPIRYGNQNITISTEKVERVREVVRTLDGEWSTNAVRERIPEMKADTIRKALIRLRENNEVRVISIRRGRGGGMVFVTTPRGRAEHNGGVS
jgi:hypothetical protein